MDTAVDTISTTMTQKSATHTQSIGVLFVRIITVTLAAENWCYDSRRGIYACAFNIGKSSGNVGPVLGAINGAALGVTGENAQGERLAAASPYGRWGEGSD